MCRGAQADSPLCERRAAALRRTRPTNCAQTGAGLPLQPLPRQLRGLPRGKKSKLPPGRARAVFGVKVPEASRFSSAPQPLDSLAPKEGKKAEAAKVRRSSGLELVWVFDRRGILEPWGGRDIGQRPRQLESLVRRRPPGLGLGRAAGGGGEDWFRTAR